MSNKSKGYFNLETTFEHAVKQLQDKDPRETAGNGAVELNSAGENSVYRIFFLNKYYLLNHATGETSLEDTGEKVSVYTAIILLHYLLTATGTPLTGQWISFKELPGGQIYIEPFRKRAINYLLGVYGNNPEKMIQDASAMGGYKYEAFGKNCVLIPALPRVPVVFNIHPGDDEFPPSANILYDAVAHLYLPTEDYAHLPGMVIKQMQGK